MNKCVMYKCVIYLQVFLCMYKCVIYEHVYYLCTCVLFMYTCVMFMYKWRQFWTDAQQIYEVFD